MTTQSCSKKKPKARINPKIRVITPDHGLVFLKGMYFFCIFTHSPLLISTQLSVNPDELCGITHKGGGLQLLYGSQNLFGFHARSDSHQSIGLQRRLGSQSINGFYLCADSQRHSGCDSLGGSQFLHGFHSFKGSQIYYGFYFLSGSQFHIGFNQYSGSQCHSGFNN